MSLCVAYSALCETDSAAYYKYLDTCKTAFELLRNGDVVSHVVAGDAGGIGRITSCMEFFDDAGGEGRDGRCFRRLLPGGVGSSCVEHVGMPVSGGNHGAGGSCSVVGGDGDAAGRAVDEADASGGDGCDSRDSGQRDAVALDGGRDGSAFCGGVAGRSGGASGDGFKPVGVRVLKCGQRGPNFERNQEKKKQRKERKQKNQLAALESSVGRGKRGARTRAERSTNWRSRSQPQHVGYFVGLSAGVQEKLKQSRAELLVAENERKALEEKQKLERLNSPVAILERAMKAVNFAGRAAKKASDSKVAGWAEAVITSYAETVAKTVESSEGSYESFVWSAKSGETAVTAAGSSAREGEYKRRVAEVHAAFNLVGTYDPASLEEELYALRSEFADVNYPPGTAERIKANMHAVEFIQRAVILDRDKVKYLEQLEREREAIELEFECTGY